MTDAIGTTRSPATIGKTVSVISVLACVAFASAAARAATVVEYLVPTAGGPSAITAGPDGNLWFTEIFGYKVGKITTDGVVTEYPVPGSNHQPIEITAGPDGNLWFTEGVSGVQGNIDKITPDGVVTVYHTPTANSATWGISAGPDGNVWFTEAVGNNIGKITTGGVITEYSIPTPNSGAFGITKGPDGNLWFTEQQGKKVGKITTDGIITEYATIGGTQFITAGPDGNIWFQDFGSGATRITTGGVLVKGYPIAFNGGAADPQDGTIWFTSACPGPAGPPVNFCTTKLLQSLTTDGVVTDHPLPTANRYLIGLTLGPDGNVWVPEPDAHKIAKVTLAHTTATGSGVTVAASPTFFNTKAQAPTVAKVDVTFPNVTGAGTTAVIATSNTTSAIATANPPPPLPPGFTADIGVCSRTKTLGCQTDANCPSGETCLAFHSVNLNVTTTASTTGSTMVCSHYDDNEPKAARRGGNGYVDGTGKPGLPEKSLRLLHEENGVLVDVTLPGYPDTLHNVVCGQVSNLSSRSTERGVGTSPNFRLAVPKSMPGGAGGDDPKLVPTTDCWSEWVLCDDSSSGGGNVGKLPKAKKSVPQPLDAVMTCKTSDPKCKTTLGGAAACNFCVRVCTNVTESTLPSCSPTAAIKEYTLSTPTVQGAGDDNDSLNARRILDGLKALSTPNGTAFGTTVTFPSEVTSSVCTTPINILIPPNGTAKKPISYMISLTASPFSGDRDADTLKLNCTP